MTSTSSLALELGAIASGEAWVTIDGRKPSPDHVAATATFAAGMERLIDERVDSALERRKDRSPLSAERTFYKIDCGGNIAVDHVATRLMNEAEGRGVYSPQTGAAPVVVAVGDLLASIGRTIAAYRAMLADPETGAAGVDATVRQMAAMAGIEVTW